MTKKRLWVDAMDYEDRLRLAEKAQHLEIDPELWNSLLKSPGPDGAYCKALERWVLELEQLKLEVDEAGRRLDSAQEFAPSPCSPLTASSLKHRHMLYVEQAKQSNRLHRGFEARAYLDRCVKPPSVLRDSPYEKRAKALLFDSFFQGRAQTISPELREELVQEKDALLAMQSLERLRVECEKRFAALKQHIAAMLEEPSQGI